MRRECVSWYVFGQKARIVKDDGSGVQAVAKPEHRSVNSGCSAGTMSISLATTIRVKIISNVILTGIFLRVHSVLSDSTAVGLKYPRIADDHNAKIYVLWRAEAGVSSE